MTAFDADSLMSSRPTTLAASSRVSQRRATAAAPARRLKLDTLGVPLFAATMTLIVLLGWRGRGEMSFTPENGLGYALGITGGTMMLLMLLYSARKRLRWLQGWGRLRLWFQIHMLLGVLGPVCILFHAKFSLGSTNSNVALGSMLLVMTSGIIGRFLHTRVSQGLHGQRVTLRELHEQLEIDKERLGREIVLGSGARARLAAFESVARSPVTGVTRRVAWFWTLSWQGRRVRAAVLHELALEQGATVSRELADAAYERVTAYVEAIVKEAQFGIYERLFSLWHALHLPIFVLLVATGIVHVVAVHMY